MKKLEGVTTSKLETSRSVKQANAFFEPVQVILTRAEPADSRRIKLPD
jgi:hypothetical protein